jgi:predicted lipoprotein
MNRPIFYCLLLFLVACSQPPEQQLLEKTADSVILPLYQQYFAATEKLNQDAITFCQSPANKDLYQTLRQDWLQAMKAWQGAQQIIFGPVQEDNQAWKIQFWPDKHNLIRKKTQALLDSSDKLTVERLTQASVVVQGLSALEYLLFDTDAGQLQQYQQPRQCQLLMAVTANSEQVAGFLYDQWRPGGGDYRAVFTSPGPDNPEFPDTKAGISALVDALASNLERAKNERLGGPLGYRNSKQRPQAYLSEAWRSQSSLKLLQANIEASLVLYQPMSDYMQLFSARRDLDQQIHQQFSLVLQQLQQLEKPLFIAVTEPEQQLLLTALYSDVTGLVTLMKNELPSAMGVNLGFNSNDGD